MVSASAVLSVIGYFFMVEFYQGSLINIFISSDGSASASDHADNNPCRKFTTKTDGCVVAVASTSITTNKARCAAKL